MRFLNLLFLFCLLPFQVFSAEYNSADFTEEQSTLVEDYGAGCSEAETARPFAPSSLQSTFKILSGSKSFNTGTTFSASIHIPDIPLRNVQYFSFTALGQPVFLLLRKLLI